MCRLSKGHSMAWNTDPISSFHTKYVVDATTGCWVWQKAPIPRGGYGAFTHRPSGFRVARAHRAAWQLLVGPLPPTSDVLHKCDNRLCVNPAHLFLGDQSSNMADKVSKGRQNRGVTHGAAKLTEEDVRAIRIGGECGKNLALRFGVSHATICDIQKYRSWTHI